MHGRSLFLLTVAIGIIIIYIFLIKLQASGKPAAKIEENTVSPETVAAITAALVVLLGEKAVKFRISAINPLPAKSNPSDTWLDASRYEVMKRQSPFSMIGRWGSK